MLNTTINPLEQTTKKIINLLEQLTREYQQIQQTETASLIKVFPPNEQELSIIEEIDLLTNDLRGFASQIKITNQIQNPDRALKFLCEIRIFVNPFLADLYFTKGDRFPTIHQYLQKLDYLQFLLIDWLSNNGDRK
jgi:hypothetical protein